MRQLILMRGVPGSGKSFEARRLAAEAALAGHSVDIHSTDNYFMIPGPDGVPIYQFDGDRIVENHGRNLAAVIRSIKSDVNVVIVDNTNVYSRDIRSLIEIGFAGDYNIVLCEPTSPWWLVVREKIGRVKDTKQCEEMARNFFMQGTHAVPVHAIAKMLQRWENEDHLDSDLREMIALSSLMCDDPSPTLSFETERENGG